MLKLISKNIEAKTVTHLASVQKSISDKSTFELKAKEANSAWNNKRGSKDARAAFDDIKKTLVEMCVGVEICVYCEQNEATDIEHIYPKKLYPEKAFVWGNYVLACGKCNSHHKSDKFRIFHPQYSTSELDVTPPRKTFREPENDDALFINQRVEDPMDFLELDLTTQPQQFIYTERHPEGTRKYLKAKYTIELLGLNRRSTLIKARRNAVLYFRDRLIEYENVINSKDFDELKKAIHDDFGGVNENANFDAEKERIKESIKEAVQSYSHPSVWLELIRQRANLPKINSLLNAAPETINWIT
jgi:uncharacterized protein (TIGR02646 family)